MLQTDRNGREKKEHMNKIGNSIEILNCSLNWQRQNDED